jgi:hypothetical protein
MRWALGASDADIARYVIYGSKPVKAVTKALVTSTLHPAAPAVASHLFVKPTVGPKLDEKTRDATQKTRDLYLTIGGGKKENPPPPPPTPPKR